jgi:Asp/Glu/hydantoin racemase
MVVVKTRTASRVLVINPNTSVSVTKRLEPILSSLHLPDITLTYWTCPEGPAIIKTQADLYESASCCIPLLLEIVGDYDGFLGACYADHPLIRLLQSYVGTKPVVGIFDASILAGLQLVTPASKFGIVTTGATFEPLLADGVKLVLGHSEQLSRFSGVVASGVGIDDLHAGSQNLTREKIINATRRLLRASDLEVDVVILGGVILCGMEAWAREACELELGQEKGQKVKIVDQMLAGMLTLDAILDQEKLRSVDYTRALR